MTTPFKKNATVRLMLCGGAAVNIGRTLFQPSSAVKKDDDLGFADIHITYVDTSRSNARDLPADSFYLIEGTEDDTIDGSAKVRRTNYAAIKQAAPDILHRHKPGDLNIIIHSAAGGSGSTIGPVVVSELLDRGEDTVVIMIGSSTCEKEISNTIDTLMSYQGVSEKREKSIVAIYLENSKENPMAINDGLVRLNTLLLAAVWSGENHGLDSKDLEHFLNYDKVSKHAPSLTGLQITSGGEALDLAKGQVVSGVVTLIREGEDPTPEVMAAYHTFGTLSLGASNAIKVKSPIHLHTVQGYFTDIVGTLRKRLAEVEEQYRVNPINRLSTKSIQLEDDGMAL